MPPVIGKEGTAEIVRIRISSTKFAMGGEQDKLTGNESLRSSF